MALGEHAISPDACVVDGVLNLVILSDDMQLTVQNYVLSLAPYTFEESRRCIH